MNVGGNRERVNTGGQKSKRVGKRTSTLFRRRFCVVTLTVTGDTL